MKNYDRIGRDYDASRCADSYLASRLAFNLDVKPRGIYLDAACGTGNYTIALTEKAGGAWHGIDCSTQVIETARGKSDTVEWRMAAVSSLPFASEFLDGAICTLAIHHFESLPLVFREIRRVLKRIARSLASRREFSSSQIRSKISPSKEKRRKPF